MFVHFWNRNVIGQNVSEKIAKANAILLQAEPRIIMGTEAKYAISGIEKAMVSIWIWFMSICVRSKIISFIRYGPEKLFPDWLKEVKKNRSMIRGREKNLRITTPYVVTHTCVVELIFKMCKELKQPADTRYRTVELFDRYV